MLRRLPAALALASILVFASACPEGSSFEEPDFCTAQQSPAQLDALILGDAYDGFLPLDDGAVSEVEYGIQGGTMIFFKVRALGADVPPCMTVNIELTTSEGASIGSSQVSVRFLEDQSGTSRTSQALRVILEDGRSYEGMAATLHANIGDAQSSVDIVMHEPS